MLLTLLKKTFLYFSLSYYTFSSLFFINNSHKLSFEILRIFLFLFFSFKNRFSLFFSFICKYLQKYFFIYLYICMYINIFALMCLMAQQLFSLCLHIIFEKYFLNLFNFFLLFICLFFEVLKIPHIYFHLSVNNKTRSIFK